MKHRPLRPRAHPLDPPGERRLVEGGVRIERIKQPSPAHFGMQQPCRVVLRRGGHGRSRLAGSGPRAGRIRRGLVRPRHHERFDSCTPLGDLVGISRLAHAEPRGGKLHGGQQLRRRDDRQRQISLHPLDCGVDLDLFVMKRGAGRSQYFGPQQLVFVSGPIQRLLLDGPLAEGVGQTPSLLEPPLVAGHHGVAAVVSWFPRHRPRQRHVGAVAGKGRDQGGGLAIAIHGVGPPIDPVSHEAGEFFEFDAAVGIAPRTGVGRTAHAERELDGKSARPLDRTRKGPLASRRRHHHPHPIQGEGLEQRFNRRSETSVVDLQVPVHASVSRIENDQNVHATGHSLPQ